MASINFRVSSLPIQEIQASKQFLGAALTVDFSFVECGQWRKCHCETHWTTKAALDCRSLATIRRVCNEHDAITPF
jgi:hypothetical protein